MRLGLLSLSGLAVALLAAGSLVGVAAQDYDYCGKVDLQIGAGGTYGMSSAVVAPFTADGTADVHHLQRAGTFDCNFAQDLMWVQVEGGGAGDPYTTSPTQFSSLSIDGASVAFDNWFDPNSAFKFNIPIQAGTNTIKALFEYDNSMAHGSPKIECYDVAGAYETSNCWRCTVEITATCFRGTAPTVPTTADPVPSEASSTGVASQTPVDPTPTATVNPVPSEVSSTGVATPVDPTPTPTATPTPTDPTPTPVDPTPTPTAPTATPTPADSSTAIPSVSVVISSTGLVSPDAGSFSSTAANTPPAQAALETSTGTVVAVPTPTSTSTPIVTVTPTAPVVTVTPTSPVTSGGGSTTTIDSPTTTTTTTTTTPSPTGATIANQASAAVGGRTASLGLAGALTMTALLAAVLV